MKIQTSRQENDGQVLLKPRVLHHGKSGEWKRLFIGYPGSTHTHNAVIHRQVSSLIMSVVSQPHSPRSFVSSAVELYFLHIPPLMNNSWSQTERKGAPKINTGADRDGFWPQALFARLCLWRRLLLTRACSFRRGRSLLVHLAWVNPI